MKIFPISTVTILRRKEKVGSGSVMFYTDPHQNYIDPKSWFEDQFLFLNKSPINILTKIGEMDRVTFVW